MRPRRLPATRARPGARRGAARPDRKTAPTYHRLVPPARSPASQAVPAIPGPARTPSSNSSHPGRPPRHGPARAASVRGRLSPDRSSPGASQALAGQARCQSARAAAAAAARTGATRRAAAAARNSRSARPQLATAGGTPRTGRSGPDSPPGPRPGPETDYRRGRINATATELQNLHVPRSQPPQHRPGPANLLRGPRTLDRENQAAGIQQSDRETGEPVHRSDGTGGDHIGGQLARHILGPLPAAPRHLARPGSGCTPAGR